MSRIHMAIVPISEPRLVQIESDVRLSQASQKAHVLTQLWMQSLPKALVDELRMKVTVSA